MYFRLVIIFFNPKLLNFSSQYGVAKNLIYLVTSCCSLPWLARQCHWPFLIPKVSSWGGQPDRWLMLVPPFNFSDHIFHHYIFAINQWYTLLRYLKNFYFENLKKYLVGSWLFIHSMSFSDWSAPSQFCQQNSWTSGIYSRCPSFWYCLQRIRKCLKGFLCIQRLDWYYKPTTFLQAASFIISISTIQLFFKLFH